MDVGASCYCRIFACGFLFFVLLWNTELFVLPLMWKSNIWRKNEYGGESD